MLGILLHAHPNCAKTVRSSIVDFLPPPVTLSDLQRSYEYSYPVAVLGTPFRLFPSVLRMSLRFVGCEQ